MVQCCRTKDSEIDLDKVICKPCYESMTKLEPKFDVFGRKIRPNIYQRDRIKHNAKCPYCKSSSLRCNNNKQVLQNILGWDQLCRPLSPVYLVLPIIQTHLPWQPNMSGFAGFPFWFSQTFHWVLLMIKAMIIMADHGFEWLSQSSNSNDLICQVLQVFLSGFRKVFIEFCLWFRPWSPWPTKAWNEYPSHPSPMSFLAHENRNKEYKICEQIMGLRSWVNLSPFTCIFEVGRATSQTEDCGDPWVRWLTQTMAC